VVNFFLPRKWEYAHVNMYTFLEEEGQISLAGESGKLTGEESYWEDLKIHLNNFRKHTFFIYSFGGGQGHDGKKIQELLASLGYRVGGYRVVDTNLLAYHLSKYRENFVLEDAMRVVSIVGDRKKGCINILHLGNFLSVLTVAESVQFLTSMASIMQEGDVASILVIRKEQFGQFSSLQQNCVTTKEGLSEFDHVSKKGSKFFRTTILDIDDFNAFVRRLGLAMIFEKIDAQVDKGGPIGMKMLFVKVGAYKTKTERT
jgi:hypothetical protein